MLTRVTLELRVFWTQTQPSNLFSSSGPHWKSHTDLQLNHPTSETNTKSPTLTELEEQGVQRIYETCFVAFLKRFSWFLVLLLCFKKLVLYKRKSGTQRAAWGLTVGVEHHRSAPGTKKVGLAKLRVWTWSSLPTNHPQVSRVSLCFCRQTVSSNSQLLTVALFVWQLDYKLLAESTRRKVRELPGQGTLLVAVFSFENKLRSST